MAFDWASMISGFLLGTVSGAVGTYYAEKFTDRRKQKEADQKEREAFDSVARQMGDFLAEVRRDLAGESNQTIREFFVLPNKRVVLGGSEKPRFIYCADEHGDLHGKLSILENRGYIIDVTTGNAPIYRMTEEFVALVRKFG